MGKLLDNVALTLGIISFLSSILSNLMFFGVLSPFNTFLIIIIKVLGFVGFIAFIIAIIALFKQPEKRWKLILALCLILIPFILKLIYYVVLSSGILSIF